MFKGTRAFSLQESFARAKNWVKELQRQASPNIVIALAGNKADLANKRALDFQVCNVFTEEQVPMISQMSRGTVYKLTNRLPDINNCLFTRVCLVSSTLTFVCTQDAQSYADDNSLLFMETSAKTSMNVNEIFMAIGMLPFTTFPSDTLK